VTGAPAASQLRITSVVGSPAIFVGHSALTVIGIVKSAQQEGQALLGVIVPPYAASVIAGANDERRVIARTAPGAAQVVGRQGPYALDPYAPSQITAEVPPDPSTLRATVQGSLTNLLKILGFAGLGIGLLTITAITMLSVSQRRPEIGLRRALGYRRADIARLIVIEAAATGVLGGILGSAVGVIATVALASSSGWTPVLTAGLIPAAPLAGILVGALAGALPSIQAMRITPIAALRS
jgi:putative ABC transport system permease protein